MNTSNEHPRGPGGGPQEQAELAQRVRALEEALGFASHESDQLRAHFLELTRAVEALERKVRRLEGELARRDQGDEGERPAGG